MHFTLTIDYGQRHRYELEAARRVALSIAARHELLSIDLSVFGGSALTGSDGVPKDRSDKDFALGIPATYVPARNTVMLSLALAYAETIPCSDIFIGVNAVDYSGYPDCRPEFIEAFERLANLATKAGVEGTLKFAIHALAPTDEGGNHSPRTRLGVDYGLTHTCYDPAEDGSCGHCDACLLRRRGFAEAGVVDPIRYRE